MYGKCICFENNQQFMVTQLIKSLTLAGPTNVNVIPTMTKIQMLAGKVTSLHHR